MEIQLSPIKSTQLSEIGYDADTQTLAVRFKGGAKVYHYDNVPKTIYDAFSNNGSAGKHYAANVRNKFKHTLHEYKGKHHGKAEKAKGL